MYQKGEFRLTASPVEAFELGMLLVRYAESELPSQQLDEIDSDLETLLNNLRPLSSDEE